MVRQQHKLSFSGAIACHYCVILSEVAEGNEVEESSAYRLFAAGKILRLRIFDAPLRMKPCGAKLRTSLAMREIFVII